MCSACVDNRDSVARGEHRGEESGGGCGEVAGQGREPRGQHRLTSMDATGGGTQRNDSPDLGFQGTSATWKTSEGRNEGLTRSLLQLSS